MNIKRWNFHQTRAQAPQPLASGWANGKFVMASKGTTVLVKPGPKHLVVPVKEIDLISDKTLARYSGSYLNRGNSYWF
jgi:Leu/Phe-tRNA-protein transferase